MEFSQRPESSDAAYSGHAFMAAAIRARAWFSVAAKMAPTETGLVEVDQRHRDHAIVEQVIAELKDGALAHLPSGKYAANAAWVACAVTAFDIARAADVAADVAQARWASHRKKIINLPARIAATARRLDLHLTRDWPWAPAWESLWTTVTGPPARATTLIRLRPRSQPRQRPWEAASRRVSS